MAKKSKYNRLTDIGNAENTALHIVFLLTTVLCVLPFLLLIMISLSSERSLTLYGYQLIPHEFSLTAYKFLLSKSNSLLRAYGISIYTTVLGLKNNTLIYIVGALMSSWNVMLMRTFLKTSIPEALVEAAKIDGAGEFRSFISIIVPLSLPGMATIALLTGVGIWNDWFTGALFVTDPTKQNLQYLMYETIQDAQYLKQHMNELSGDSAALLRSLPTESARMAMCVFAVGPIILVYPFLQKYFVKGMVIGAVKG